MSISGELHSRFPSAQLTVLESEARGTRELRSALVEQALAAQRAPAMRVLLVVRAPTMTSSRLRKEWDQFLEVLQPAVAHRLAFAAAGVNGVVTTPTDQLTQGAAQLLDTSAPGPRPRSYRWDHKRFEVFGALFDAWLEKEGPLSIGALLERAAVSYPTARVTLDALLAREEVTRTSSRSVEFSRLPRRSLEELVPRLNELRETSFYVDGSGRAASPESLLVRLQQKRFLSVQVGGVSAAREYWPSFNLKGLPRVDVTVAWDAPPAWLHTLDPALQRAPQSSPHVILAVHHSRAPLKPDASLARRATVVFDLYSLGLGEQAEDFIRHSRR